MERTSHFRIGGMTCGNCQNRIEKKLKSTPGVEDASVSFRSGAASVTWNPSALTEDEIKAAIESLGYQVLDGKEKNSFAAAAGTLALIVLLYALFRVLGINTLISAFPLAEAGMGAAPGMLFILGLVTSVHCAGMCGGINLSQCLSPAVRAAPDNLKKRFAPLFPSILYNAGRVLSYTAVGAAAGALGAVIAIPRGFQGMVQLIAGVFMVVMGINMLGIFPGLRRFIRGEGLIPKNPACAGGALGRSKRVLNPSPITSGEQHTSPFRARLLIPRMPKFFAGKRDEQKPGDKSPGGRNPGDRSPGGRNPLLIGLLNGLMPCGPLQAMQLYALSTGSPAAGGTAMLLFSLGTVPLMFGIGALSSLLSAAPLGRAFSAGVMKTCAVLVAVMGMNMFTYGWGLSAFNLNFFPIVDRAAASKIQAAGGVEASMPPVERGVQIVNSTLSPGRYPAITVQRGIPVRWTINAPQGSINGCNNRMIIREYKIEHRFSAGENVIEFTPERAGRFSYSCWMGMIRSSITVIEEGQTAEAGDSEPGPVPAGAVIPVDRIALAEIEGAGAGMYQKAAINLRDDGIDPAVIVVRRGIPAVWIINNDSLDSGNSRLIFPAYYTRMDMDQGDNVIQFMPEESFDFSTGDNVFYGFVKVVEDLDAVDLEALRDEAENFETLIYPDAYFENSAEGAGCCG